MRALMVVLVAVAWMAATPGARAQSCTATAPDIYFGNVSTPVPQVDVATPVNLSCSGTPNTTLRVCVGITPSNWFFGTRRMFLSFFNSLGYQIYSDPAYSQPWENAGNQRVLVTVPLGASGQGSTVRNLYARMPGGTSPAAGLYQSEVSDDTLVGEIKPGNAGCNSGSSVGTFTGNAFNVSTFVNGTCTISVDPVLDFGTVMGTVGAPIDSSISLRARCNQDLPYTIALGDGQHAVAGQRRMRSAAGDYLDYGLFQDPARAQRWGDGTPDPVRNGTGSGAQQTMTIHGRVPGGQAAPGGTYQDTVTATITY